MIVHLDINSYVGTAAFGAVHYYAELRWMSCDPNDDDSWRHIEHGRVYGTLTAQEAKLTNLRGSRTAEGKKHKKGDVCFGWLTEEEAIRHGLEKFQSTFNLKKDVLILGSPSSAEPQPILHGPQELKDKIQAWIDAIERAENGQFFPDDLAKDVAQDEFWEFWKEYEKTHTNRVVKFDEWAGIHDPE